MTVDYQKLAAEQIRKQVVEDTLSLIAQSKSLDTMRAILEGFAEAYREAGAPTTLEQAARIETLEKALREVLDRIDIVGSWPGAIECYEVSLECEADKIRNILRAK